MVAVDVAGRDVRALIDTGADYSVISAETATNWGCRLSNKGIPTLCTAGEEPLSLKGAAWLRFTLAGKRWDHRFLVSERLTHPLILGIDFLRQHGAVLDCAAGMLTLQEGKYSAKVQSSRRWTDLPVRLSGTHTRATSQCRL